MPAIQMIQLNKFIDRRDGHQAPSLRAAADGSTELSRANHQLPNFPEHGKKYGIPCTGTLA
jgi:hypothetical protein